MSNPGQRIARDVIAAGIFLFSVIPAAAQIQPPNVPRDRPPAEAPGKGSISGRVVDGITGAPLARARVLLQGGGQPSPIVTDASGRFVFSQLRPGGYIVAATKSTYQPARFPDAGQTMRAQMQRLTLADGEAIAGVTLRMFRGAAITGRVFDASGDPVEYAEIRALRVTAAGGRPATRGGSSTNDIGEFRLARLEPGTYILMAVGRRIGMMENTSPGATPSPISLPTYYPGALALDQAQPITVQRGQTVSDVDITLFEGTPAIVSGTVVSEDGQPVAGNGMVIARTVVRDGGYGMEGGGASVKPDGTFQFALAPGDYTLEARVIDRANARATSSTGGVVGGMVMGVAGSGRERVGHARLSVGGSLDGVTIVVGAGATATGKVIFEGTSPLPTVPPIGQFRLPLNAPDGNCRQGQTTLRPDWTFVVEGLAGTCSAAPQMSFGNWTLKSVTMGDQELLYETVTFETGQRLSNVVVVMTDRRGAVGFDVADERGEPTSEYVAIVYPVAGINAPIPNVRTFVPQPPSPTAAAGPTPSPAAGATLGGLPAGEYYVVAVDDIAYEDLRDPAVMKRLSASATRVTVGETPTTRVSLRRVPYIEASKRDR